VLLPAALSLLPSIPALRGQLSTAEVKRESLLGAFGTIARCLASFVVPIREGRYGARVAADVLAGAALLGMALRTPQRRRRLRQSRFLRLLALTASLHAGARHTVGAPMNFPHMMTVLYVAFVAALGDLVDAIWEDAVPAERVALQGTLVGLGLRTAVAAWYPGAKRGDWKRVAAKIMRDEAPGEPIFVYHAEAAVPLAYHYAGPNVVVPLPRPMGAESWDPERLVIRDAQEVEEAVQSAGPFATCWLAALPATSFLELDLHPEVLTEYVGRHFDVLAAERFFDCELLRLKRR
jgi:hypothetical protein